MGTIEGKYFAEIVSLGEMKTQCKFAMRAFSEMDTGAKQGIRLHRGDGVREEPFLGTLTNVHYHLQAFLSHAQIVSNFLFMGNRDPKKWESSKKKTRMWKNIKNAETRSARMRELTGITSLPALENLAARDSVHHIDERIDEFIFSGWDGRRISVNPIHVTPAGLTLGPDQYVIRLLKSEDMTARIVEDEISLLPVRDAILDVLEKTKQAESGLHNFTGRPLYEMLE